MPHCTKDILYVMNCVADYAINIPKFKYYFCYFLVKYSYTVLVLGHAILDMTRIDNEMLA